MSSSMRTMRKTCCISAGIADLHYATGEIPDDIQIPKDKSNLDEFIKEIKPTVSPEIDTDSKINLLEDFAKKNNISNISLSNQDILKLCGDRLDLAQSLLLATKESKGNEDLSSDQLRSVDKAPF